MRSTRLNPAAPKDSPNRLIEGILAAFCIGKHCGFTFRMLFASLGVAWMSEVLVGVTEQAGHSSGMSQMFMSVIVLALVGGATEYVSAIAMG